MIRVFFLLFALLFALSGCTGKDDCGAERKCLYDLLFKHVRDPARRKRVPDGDDGPDALVRELLDKMGNVPADLDCQRALPERIEKITYRIEGNVLYLYADANYALMNSVQEILCRAALTKDTDPDSGYRVSEHLLRGAADHGRCGKPGGNAFRL